MTASVDDIRAHWDAQSEKGPIAGTQDLILKALEQRAILQEIPVGVPHVLEVGCGLGETAVLVADRKGCRVWAIDASEGMVRRATPHPRVSYDHYSVLELDRVGGLFRIVYSQRCLINLPTWEAQRAALDAIAGRLSSGGRFLMCEHSQDGLDALNDERVAFGLDPIQPPFHNRYFRDAELATVTSLRLVSCLPFSSRYYYHSRVVNAWLAQQTGQAPEYAAPVNQMALETDRPFDGRYAQGRLWVWEKA